MAKLDVVIVGELRPPWLIKLEAALDEARERGWTLTGPVVLEGEPYVWKGEPKMSRWTVHP